MRKIAVVLGSIRAGRFSERPARWIVEQLRKRNAFEVQLLDLRDYPLPFFAEETAPARAPRKYRTPEIERWGKAIDAADGFIWVTPEYNHGPAAVLKNALDHLFIEWRHKPVTFVAHGGAGGARAVEQLRMVAVELEMAPLRHALHILPPILIEARKTPSIPDEQLFQSLEPRVDQLADDLRWWTDALAVARAQPATTP